MLLHRKWYLLVPFMLSVVISVVLCYVLPKTYKSTTLILVEQQKVPDAYVKSSVSTDMDERVNTIQQQIMSRTLLRSVIDEFGLYKDKAGRSASDESAEMMRKNIEIKIERGRTNIDAFSISYEGTDPGTVMLVTNKLASLFIEESLKAREEFVEGTSDFLENELNGIKAELEAQEKKIREFKQAHMGDLPEQMAANLRTLDRLQLEQQTMVEAMSRAKERRALLLEKNPNLMQTTADQLRDTPPGQLRLMQLRSELADLQTRFTDKYPDVIRVKKEIADLEVKLKADASQQEKARDPKNKTNVQRKDFVEPDGTASNGVQGQYNLTDMEILHLEERQKQISSQMKEYQARVESEPLREQQMLALMRDYENTKLHYQSLLDKKLNARISENLEKRQKGEQFRILDPADLPKTPYKPDQFRIILLGIVAGLGAGGGAAYLRDMMDVSFRKANEVETILQFPVLVSIPNIGESLKQERKSA